MKKYVLINDSGEVVAEEQTMIDMDAEIIRQQEENTDCKLWIAQVTHEVIGVHVETKRLFNNPASNKEK